MIYPNLAIIAALAENLAIGKDNRLLFHFPEDLKRFKRITQGHPVIMGKKTFYSLPKGPLPNRRNIIISREQGLTLNGCEVVPSIAQAVELVKDEPLAFIIGGGDVYRQFFPIVGKMFLTIINKSFEADTYFPAINFEEWEVISKEDFYDQGNGFSYTNLDLVRKE
jgi:dihydrofolate reductase